MDFPLWIRLTHFFNFIFLTLLIRSGIEIIGAHPKFYWGNDCEPGKEWLRLSKKRLPENELWTSEDEIQPYNSWIALPGKNNLGLGRHWHFWSLTGWLITGFIYVILLFTTSEWHRLIPTSWNIFWEAWEALKTYLSFNIPEENNTYNALQKLTYFSLIFLLTPLQIITGVVLAPAVSGRFPGFMKLFGGRQSARSIHFLGMIVFLMFFVIHITMVFAHGFTGEMAKIVLGNKYQSHQLALIIGLSGILTVLIFNILSTYYSLTKPFKTKKFLEKGIDNLMKFAFHHTISYQNYDKISPYARVNGRPPKNLQYQKLLENNFSDFKLKIYGLVENPAEFSLTELKALNKKEQTTLHVCIQGWTYYAKWGGVSISELLQYVKPLQGAKYLVFHTLDEKWEKPEHGYFYEVIDLELAYKPQTIIAYEMNNNPLPINHGAPLRLRLESQLGYKMAKYVSAIELVDDFNNIGEGPGGWRDDILYYHVKTAGI